MYHSTSHCHYQTVMPNRFLVRLFLVFLIFLISFLSLKAQSPGGVSGGLKLWTKANAGVTTSGSNVTGWADQAGVNTFTVTGTPQLNSTGINFNPSISFDGSSRFTGNTSITNATEAFAVAKIVNSSGVSGSGAILGTVGASNYAYFFHTESGTLYGSGSNSPGISYYGTNSLGNSINWSVMNGDLSETPAASQQMKVNGIAYSNNAGGDPGIYNGTPVIGARYTENILSGSQVAEVIVYNASEAGTNRSRIISYLALKYGITLGNTSTTVSYLASDGSTIWTGNSTYQNDIIGLGKDNGSGLEQQITTSQDVNGDIITLSTDNNFTGANGSHTSVASDKFFFIAGNNGGSTSVYTSKTGLSNSLNAILGRVWKVQQTGTVQNVYIKTSNSLATYLIYSTDATFSTGVSYVALTNGVTSGVQIPNGNYFTFAGYLKSPGGVTGVQLWLEANNFGTSTADNTAITTWSDISGNGNDATGYNSPAFRAGSNSSYALNFNPTVTFNGSNQYFQAPNGFADFTAGLGLFSVHNFTSTGSWARIIDFGTGQAADNILFARNGTNTYYSGQTWNGGTGSGYVSTSAGSVFSNTYGVGSWNIPAGSVGATVSSTITLKGTTSATANIIIPSNTNRTLNYIARSNWSVDAYFKGYMPELILYKRLLSAAEQLQVNSYLALKYGFNLKTAAGAASNYVASDGTTVFWNASTNSSYTNNVFGIGKDNLSSLEQQISASQESSADILTLSTDNNFTGANGTHTSVSNNLSFLMIGNNGGSSSSIQSTGLPSGFCGSRIVRSWKVQKTNSISAVNLQANIGTTLGASLSASNIVLLIDQDGDGDFSTGSQTAIYASGYSSGVAVFSGVNFDSDNSGTDVFVIAARTSLPVLVSLGNSSTNGSSCVTGSYSYYQDAGDATKTIIAFNTNGNSFTPTSINAVNSSSLTASGVSNGGGYYQQTTGVNTIRVANRFYTVIAPGSYTVNGGVTVRIYYASADTATMLTDAFPSSATLGDYGWYKSSVSSASAVVGNMQNASLLNAVKVIPTSYGTENGIRYVEFQVTSFSTFGYYAKTIPA
ncbi:MAG TPA: hypothetical protein VMT76_02115, partial [Puia sp.]|nr:hypothetical protein [Puia sp.]